MVSGFTTWLATSTWFTKVQEAAKRGPRETNKTKTPKNGYVIVGYF